MIHAAAVEDGKARDGTGRLNQEVGELAITLNR
jgi:hypothetical protein